VLAAALPATVAPLPGLHYLVGSWNCTYSAGAVRLAHDATYAYDRDGYTLRQIASWRAAAAKRYSRMTGSAAAGRRRGIELGREGSRCRLVP
jgi:hypothetical protein